MKKMNIVLIFFALLSCNLEHPTQFTEDVLNESFVDLKGDDIQFKTILETYKGKKVLIDVWASWCADCINGLPTVKSIQNEFPNVEYLFLSVDRNEGRWQKALKKYNIKGDHYFVPDGQKGVFGDFLNSNWIPRYMVLDTDGSIKLFKAKNAKDTRLKKALQ